MRKTLLKTLSATFLMITASQLQAFAPLPYDAHAASDLEGSYLLTFEDGSEWKVAESDEVILNQWYAEKSVASVTVNPNYRSNRYDYYITNQETGSYVSAILLEAPLKESVYAVSIKEIDKNTYISGNITLSNGTTWRVSAFDWYLTKKWYTNDFIIVGVNTEKLSYNSHILINPMTNTFVRVQKVER